MKQISKILIRFSFLRTLGFFNLFQANVLFLWPLKTLENFWFSNVFRDYGNETSAWNELRFFPSQKNDKSDNWLFIEFHNILVSVFYYFFWHYWKKIHISFEICLNQNRVLQHFFVMAVKLIRKFEPDMKTFKKLIRGWKRCCRSKNQVYLCNKYLQNIKWCCHVVKSWNHPFIKPLTTSVLHDIGTSHLFSRANELTGVYMMGNVGR